MKGRSQMVWLGIVVVVLLLGIVVFGWQKKTTGWRIRRPETPIDRDDDRRGCADDDGVHLAD